MSLRNLFARPNSGTPRLPLRYRAYAVGDIHGRDDLLVQLLRQIEDDNASRSTSKTLLIFLGDLIDRGPASAGVIERLRTYQHPGIRPCFLLGNHEEVLLRILGGEGRLLADWLRFGGSECLASYGLDAALLHRKRSAAAIERIRSVIPAAHVEFLSAFDDTLRVGDYLFVHAGIRPGLPLSSQLQSDLRWIRAPFLDSDYDHGFTVVHGHTISADVDRRGRRIGIDTGAYSSGRLTALGLEGEQQWVLQTGTSVASHG